MPSDLAPDAPHLHRGAHVARRRNAVRRYIIKLNTTYPSLSLADRQALADLLVNGPQGADR